MCAYDELFERLRDRPVGEVVPATVHDVLRLVNYLGIK